MPNVLRLALELFLYLEDILKNEDISVRKAQQLKMLYNLLNDFIRSNLEKERGDLNVTGTKK